MTRPGYTDWSRYQTPSADNIASEASVVAAFHNGPVVDCSEWAGVSVTCFNADANAFVQVVVAWAGYNPTLSNFVSDEFVVGPGQEARFSVPTRGRTVQVKLSLLSGAQTFGVTYGVVGTRTVIGKYQSASLGRALIAQVIGMPATTTTTLPISDWYEGPVVITCGTGGGNIGFASIQYFDANTSSWTEFLTIPFIATTSAPPVHAFFPPAPIQAALHNQGGAQNVGFEIVPSTS